jgi:hypothetical protein
MTDRNLKITAGILSAILFITLILKLDNVPGGMILSGLFLGIIIIFGILLACLLFASLLGLILKKYSFFTLYLVCTVVTFSIFHYQLYSPTLKIIVPRDYQGDVNLVLSNVKDNILNIDSNGVGYINQWTFDKTYNIPEVVDSDGKNLNKFCIGFNPSTLWGKGRMCCISGQEIMSLDFEIAARKKSGQKNDYSRVLTTLVNKKLLLLKKTDEYTKIDSASVPK